MLYAKVFQEFLFVFLYLIMCIVFKIHPFFFFLYSIRKNDEERPVCMCKDMDHMLIMV